MPYRREWSNNEQKILDALRGDAYGKTFTEIASKTNIKTIALKYALELLIKQGKVECRMISATIKLYRIKQKQRPR